MKTPREVLLERHRAVEPQLNRIRAQVLSLAARAQAVCPSGQDGCTRSFWTDSWFRKSWLELVWAPRRIWVGFVLLWAVMFAINWSCADHSARLEAGAGPPPGEALAVWQQQQRLLVELINSPETPATEKPRPAEPEPRSEREPAWRLG